MNECLTARTRKRTHTHTHKHTHTRTTMHQLEDLTGPERVELDSNLEWFQAEVNWRFPKSQNKEAVALPVRSIRLSLDKIYDTQRPLVAYVVISVLHLLGYAGLYTMGYKLLPPRQSQGCSLRMFFRGSTSTKPTGAGQDQQPSSRLPVVRPSNSARPPHFTLLHFTSLDAQNQSDRSLIETKSCFQKRECATSACDL